jgi:hypothetical protein
VEPIGRIPTFLSRYEVFPGWDAWTLLPVALALLALVAAFVYYGWSLYRRLRSPAGVDWDRELGASTPAVQSANPRDRFAARLQLLVVGVLSVYMGFGALRTGHFTSSRHGRTYSADGTPARVCGGLLCVAGLMLGVAVLFPDAAILNRPLFGGRGRLP